MTERASNETGRSYDTVAEEYARRVAGELDDKPFDREQLDRFARMVQPGAPVADVGCGPGHVARYLHERGVSVEGVDLSEGMVEVAARLHPGIEFRRGDMAALPAADEAWAGIVAFYSLIHIARPRMVAVLREFARVLRPGAPLLLSFHIGEEDVHLGRWWDRDVSLDFLFFRTGDMESWLAEAGLQVDEVLEREPYAEAVEAQTRRGYIFARRPRTPATEAR